MPSPGKPHAEASRSRSLQTVSRSPDRADPSEGHRRARQERGDNAAQHRSNDREPARARSPLRRRAAGGDLPSRVSAAQLARQSEGVGRSLPRAAGLAPRLRTRLANGREDPKLTAADDRVRAAITGD